MIREEPDWTEEERRFAAIMQREPRVWTQGCLEPEDHIALITQGAAHPNAKRLRTHLADCAYCSSEFLQTQEVLQVAEEALRGAKIEAKTITSPHDPAPGSSQRFRFPDGLSFWRRLFAPTFGFAVGVAAASLIIWLVVSRPLQVDLTRTHQQIAGLKAKQTELERTLAQARSGSEGPGVGVPATGDDMLGFSIGASGTGVYGLGGSYGGVFVAPSQAEIDSRQKARIAALEKKLKAAQQNAQDDNSLNDTETWLSDRTAGSSSTTQLSLRPITPDRAIVIGNEVTFMCLDVGAEKYRFTIRKDGLDVVPPVESPTPQATITLPPNKNYVERYIWFVQANVQGEVQESAGTRFAVLATTKPKAKKKPASSP